MTIKKITPKTQRKTSKKQRRRKMHHYLPPFIPNFIQQKIQYFCEETDNVCHHWIDQEFYSNLVFLDEKDGGNRAKDYHEKCHQLEVICRPPINNKIDHWEICLKCKPNRASSEKCFYKNDAALERFIADWKLTNCKTKIARE